MIVHEPAHDWALPTDHDIYNDVKLARLKQNIETPLNERIEFTTWPETVAYFATVSMDGRYATRETEELYRYSFRQYLDRWTPLDPDEQPQPLCTEPNLSEYRLERLNDLRFGIKKDRDKYFVDHRYDEIGINDVPKSFWLTDYEQQMAQQSLDQYSQSALREFYSD